jgi:hypothetical protein
MNERIRELAEQVVGPSRLFGGEFALMGDKQVEQFGELIVKECIRHFNEDYQRDFDTLWREDLTNSIKNHFGVE